MEKCIKLVLLLACACASESIYPYYADRYEGQYASVAITPNDMIKEDPSKDIQLRRIIDDLYPKPDLLAPPQPVLPELLAIKDNSLHVDPNSGTMNLLDDIELRKNIEDLFASEPAPPQPVPLSSPGTHNDDNNDGRCTDSFENFQSPRSNLNQDIVHYFGAEVGNEPNRLAVLPASSNLSDADHDITTESGDDYRFIDPATFQRKYNNYVKPEKSFEQSHKDTPPPAPVEAQPPSDNHFVETQTFPRHDLTAGSPAAPTVATTTNTGLHNTIPASAKPPSDGNFVVKHASSRSVTVDSTKPTVVVTTKTNPAVSNSDELIPLSKKATVPTGIPPEAMGSKKFSDTTGKAANGSHSFRYSYMKSLFLSVAIISIINLYIA